jgi:phosphoadenosine phosphosulfate reductase
MTILNSLEIIAAEWDKAARELMCEYGKVNGTQIFLKEILHDQFFGDKTAITSSFGIEAAVPLALVAEAKPSTPVIAVDTGRLFTLTHKYREDLVAGLGLTDVRVPRPSPEQAASFDPEGNPPTCCDVVKKDLMTEALKGFSVLITGRKRYQGDQRSHIPVVEVFEGRLRVNPLALWSEEQVKTFMAERNLPHHALEERGFESVGCQWPCSRPGKGRSGRTFAHGGTECGLHIDGSGI